MKLAWSAVLALGMAATAWAEGEDDDDKKPAPVRPVDEEAYRDLESRVRALERTQDKPAPAAAQQTWDPSKMLSFSTPDGNFTAKIGGRIYLTYRHIFDRDDVTGGAPDTLGLDTARIQLDGSFYKDFFYRVETEAQSQSDAGRHRMKDTYLGWNAVPSYLTVMGGQMKMSWSQEETCSSRFIEMGERSILNRLAPAHNVGVRVGGTLADKIVEWNLGVYNTALARDAGRNGVDASDEKMVGGRIFVTPFRTSDDFIKQLRVGIDAFGGDIDGGVVHPDITTGDLGGVAFADFNATANVDGMRTAYLFNFHWGYGPASVRGEYAVINQEFLSTSLESDFEITAWSLHGALVLTGEEKTLENRIKPKANLNLSEGTFGAFELTGRIAMVEVADEAVTGGIMAAGENQETREIAVGINWWWSPNMGLRLSWHRFSFDEDLTPPIGSGNSLEDQQDVFYVRWQIDF